LAYIYSLEYLERHSNGLPALVLESKIVYAPVSGRHDIHDKMAFPEKGKLQQLTGALKVAANSMEIILYKGR
jgi:hypothetical protein